eukprot:CFRG2129T1
MSLLFTRNLALRARHASRTSVSVAQTFNKRNISTTAHERSLPIRVMRIGMGTFGVVFVSAYISGNVMGDPLPRTPAKRSYHWISPEAQELIARNYQRHSVLSDPDKENQKELTMEEMKKLNESLERLGDGVPPHYEPESLKDKCAEKLMFSLERVVHMFFREKYDHHAVTLETLAAVPGIVAGAYRHTRSLRKMEPDHGWINPLQEEAENERMHLLIWMQVTQPSWLERQFVIFSQGLYMLSYALLYGLSPSTSHRLVGYLEEAAFTAYTDFLRALDEGSIENVEAPSLARAYYRLPEGARLRDVVLRVRADECMHRDYNHELSDMHINGLQNTTPHFMTTEFGKCKMPPGPWWRSNTGTLKRTWTSMPTKSWDEPICSPKLPRPGSAGPLQDP